MRVYRSRYAPVRLPVLFWALVWASVRLDAAPEVVFNPVSVNFGEVPVGSTAAVALVVTNPGDTAAVVSSVALASGGASAFSAPLAAFQVVPGDTATLSLRFAPRQPNSQADVLVFTTGAGDALLAVSGTGVGPNLRVSARRLVFDSPGIGSPDTAQVRLTNSGNDTLRITALTVADARFRAGASALTLAPDSSRTLNVIYTPDGTGALASTLTVRSNDFDEGTLAVALEALETPRSTGNARLRLSRADTLAFPQPGDTVSVDLTLLPRGDFVGGVELYFGYDATLFRPADAARPFLRTGYTERGVVLKHGDTTDVTAGRRVAFLSILTQGSITAEGRLTRLDLVALAPMQGQTVLRVLNVEPDFNSKYITPASTTFTLPPENRLTLGNTPPAIRLFPLLEAREDEAASIALAQMAFDQETPGEDLAWSFLDARGLVEATVTDAGPGVGRVARFFAPPDSSGVFPVLAIVTDPAGASDSALVVVEVTPVNDPPFAPVYESPEDGAEEVTAPVLFQWAGGDPDIGDRVVFDFLLGTSPEALAPNAQRLAQPAHTVAGLGAGTTYYWQVVATDASGARTFGPVRQFLTAPDREPPVLDLEPLITEVTFSSATFTWRTNEPALSRIRYGPKEGFADSVDVEEFVLGALLSLVTVTVPDLQADTEYAYQVILEDAVGNVGQSTVGEFTTPEGPAVSEPGGDLDGDGDVDFADFVLFAQAFGSREGDAGYRPDADLDGNGAIEFRDFVQFALLFGGAPAASRPIGDGFE